MWQKTIVTWKKAFEVIIGYLDFSNKIDHIVNRTLHADILCPNVLISVMKNNCPKSPLQEERKITRKIFRKKSSRDFRKFFWHWAIENTAGSPVHFSGERYRDSKFLCSACKKDMFGYPRHMCLSQKTYW